MNDPFVGQLTFFRVYSGTLDAGLDGLQRDQGQARAHRPPPAHARQQARGHQGRSSAGNIAAAVGPARHDDRRHAVRREGADPPRAHGVRRRRSSRRRSSRSTKADQDKMGVALQRLAMEDPTFRVHTDEETGQTIISRHGRAAPRDHRRPHAARVQGRGQRRQAAGRVPRDHHDRRSSEEYRHIKQTGGHGQYGHVKLRIEPERARQGLRLRQRDRRRRHPAASSSRPIEKGVEEALRARRARRASRWSTSRSRSIDGSYHEVDSSAMAFEIAARWRFSEARATRQAHPARADHGASRWSRPRTTWAP